MGLGGVTTGRGGEFPVEPERPRALVLPLRYELSVSFSKKGEFGREIVNTEEVRRLTPPMRADHFNLALEVLILVAD
jgi:hypothetical protein